MTTDAVLAEIDATLEDWETGEDAAIWDPAALPAIDPEDQDWCAVLCAATGMDGYAAAAAIDDAREFGHASPWYGEVRDAAEVSAGTAADFEPSGIRGLTPSYVIIDEAWQFDSAAMAEFGRAVTTSMGRVQEFAQELSRQLVPALTQAMTDAGKMIASVYGFSWTAGQLHYHDEDAPRRVLRRCRACHPEAFSLPLAIDGQDYRRRSLARRRRRRG